MDVQMRTKDARLLQLGDIVMREGFRRERTASGRDALEPKQHFVLRFVNHPHLHDIR